MTFGGLERLNLKFDPLNPERRKIGTFGWWSLGNCSRPNYGNVSPNPMKLGA